MHQRRDSNKDGPPLSYVTDPNKDGGESRAGVALNALASISVSRTPVARSLTVLKQTTIDRRSLILSTPSSLGKKESKG